MTKCSTIALSDSGKPVVRADDKAAMRAWQQARDYEVTALSLGWSVRNRKTGATYNVRRTFACTCPHYSREHAGTHGLCKHGALVRLLLAVAPDAIKTAPEATPAPAASATELRRQPWESLSRQERLLRTFGPDC